MAPSFFHTSLHVIMFTVISINFMFPAFSSSSAPAISYKDHCSSIVPKSNPTNPTYLKSLPDLLTSYYTGGEQLLGRKQSKQIYSFAGRSIRLGILPNCYETNAKGVYKVEAFLNIRSPYRYRPSTGGNYSYGSYYRGSVLRGRTSFLMNGFWSEISRKLCVVGSASSQVEGGKNLNRDAVFKLSYASENPNMNTSVVNWILESLSAVNDPAYFDPIFAFCFPVLSNYHYSLVSEELDKGLLKDFVVPKNQSLSLDSERTNFCSLLSGRSIVLELDYGVKCEHCSPLDGGDGFLPRFLSLSPIQCSWNERRLRYIVAFQNISYSESFGLDSSLIGEASWDDKNNELYVVACRFLNPSSHFGSGVGDCSTRLSLRFPLIWTISNDAMIIGELWSTKGVKEIGHFRRINLTSTDGSDMVDVPGRRFVYTETDRIRKACTAKKTVKKGNVYPDGNSYSMRFDLSVRDSKGEQFAFGYATPISVGSELYERTDMLVAVDSVASTESGIGVATINEDEISTKTGPLNISYKIRINPFVWSLNSSMNLQHQVVVDIIAEGVYDAKTGSLCMVGCKKLPLRVQNSTHTSRDCEVLVKFEFAALNEEQGGFIKGNITSTRAKSDPLYFDDLSLSSAAYYPTEAKRSIWRMDLEITMVLISNTLSCIFIGIQLFHVKRNPEALSCISLAMLLILSLGHLIPLVLNFEAVFFENHSKQTVVLSNGRWLEANEVTVRVITMVAFLLQTRLLQLVWTAKQSEGNDTSLSNGEKKAVLVSLPLYILGGLITFLINRTRNKATTPYGFHQKRSLWGDLRSYAGLILDGFLLPQILLNTFTGSRVKALSHPFYIGTSAIRLVPHAYDQYRLHNYPRLESNVTYFYANPTADFYSTAWDIVIPCGVIILAVIVFLQQRHGGRWILPRRFREVELYEKVPVVDNEG